MAAEHVFRAVIGHGNVALAAGHNVAAISAGNKRRKAAPVDEQNRLPAAFEAPIQPVDQRTGKHASVALFQLLAHIDDMHRRHRAVVDTPRHFQQPQIPAPGHREGAHARRCAGQQQRRALPRASLVRQPARIVMRVVVGDIALLVFLVDDDQTDVLQRREDR